METFLQSVYYESGGYSTCDGMSKLDSRLRELEVEQLPPYPHVFDNLFNSTNLVVREFRAWKLKITFLLRRDDSLKWASMLIKGH